MKNQMKKLFFLVFALYSGVALCTTVTITNSGFTFSPASVTINLGDSVKFVLASNHDAEEVSQVTWNANGNTPLPGFSTPFGGGLVLPAQLTVGTHYYVCSPHASLGMKGVIIVQDAQGVAEHQLQATISVFPNPSSGKFNVAVDSKQSPINKMDLETYNMLGEKVYSMYNIQHISSNVMDMSAQPDGVYFIHIKTEQGTNTKKITIAH
jgi:plastocyanin